MQTNPLFLGLVIAGVILVLGVVIINWLQVRGVRPKSRADGGHAGDAQPKQAPTVSPAVSPPANRVEPVFKSDIAPNSVDSDDRGLSSAVAQAREDELPVPTVDEDMVPELPQPLSRRASKASLNPDPDIECVVMLRPAQPVATAPLLAAIQTASAKPMRWLGRQIPGAPWQALDAATPGPWAEIAACLLLANRAGAASRTDIDQFLKLVQQTAPLISATASLPEPAAEASRADALDRICADLDVQVGLTVLKSDLGQVTGTRLRGVAEAAGFQLTPAGHFEFVQEDTGAVLYTLQNVRSDPFTVESLRQTSTPGIVFLLDVPRVQEPGRVFDQMRMAAKRMTKTLDATLVDDNRVPLDDAALAGIRAQVEATADALVETHIEPGSPRALRLFG